jgi:hypothetical protein
MHTVYVGYKPGVEIAVSNDVNCTWIVVPVPDIERFISTDEVGYFFHFINSGKMIIADQATVKTASKTVFVNSFRMGQQTVPYDRLIVCYDAGIMFENYPDIRSQQSVNITIRYACEPVRHASLIRKPEYYLQVRQRRAKEFTRKHLKEGHAWKRLPNQELSLKLLYGNKAYSILITRFNQEELQHYRHMRKNKIIAKNEVFDHKMRVYEMVEIQTYLSAHKWITKDFEEFRHIIDFLFKRQFIIATTLVDYMALNSMAVRGDLRKWLQAQGVEIYG